MDRKNIIEQKTPAEIRTYHLHHDIIHQLIPSLHNQIWIEPYARDDSCQICAGQPTNNLDEGAHYKVLKALEDHGILIPSYRTYAKFSKASLPATGGRRTELIRKMLYDCRYTKYPTSWDNLVKCISQSLNGYIVLHLRILSPS